MSIIDDKLTVLATSVQGFVTQVLARITAPRPNATEALDVEFFINETKEQHMAAMYSIYSQHIGDTTTNPHDLTPAKIGAYDSAEFDALAKSKFPTSAATAISRYGALDGSLPIVEVDSGWEFTFTNDVPVILSGIKKIMQGETFSLVDIESDPSNAVFNVYVLHDSGEIAYDILKISPPSPLDTIDRMLIGTITTDATTITNIDINVVTRIGKYRLSTIAAPNAISVTPGLPMEVVGLNWS